MMFIGDFFYKTRTSLARAAFYREFLQKTRASLARAAFNRDFLYNQKGNPLKKGVVQSSEPSPLSTSCPFDREVKKSEKKSESDAFLVL